MGTDTFLKFYAQYNVAVCYISCGEWAMEQQGRFFIRSREYIIMVCYTGSYIKVGE